MNTPKIFKTAGKLPKGTRVKDLLPGALRELFLVTYPAAKHNQSAYRKKIKEFITKHERDAVFIYFPWRKLAVRSLSEEMYFSLRTARNRNLITKEEQKKYRSAVVGIAGLSVGSSIVSALTISGGPKTMKIADFDKLEISNLNRIAASILDIGESKIGVIAKQVWEANPFSKLELWDHGLTKQNIGSFIGGKPKLDFFVDEMDNIALKIEARFVCKKYGIPVIMVTDNGDGIILDIERFDLEPKRPPFHGVLGRTTKSADYEHLTPLDWLRTATKIMGMQEMTPEHQESLLLIGKKLSGPPQLGTAAMVAGAAVSYAIRRITSGKQLPSGKYTVGFEEKLIPGYTQKMQQKIRLIKTKRFAVTIGK